MLLYLIQQALYEKATTVHAFAGIVSSRMNVDELIVSTGCLKKGV